MPKACCFDYYNMMPPTLFFFLKITLAIWVLLWFQINFNIICSGSVKNAIGILTGIALNLSIALGSMDILMMLILLVHKHVITLHLFISSSISFFSVLYFSEYSSFTFLVKFIPGYFILFDVSVNGIIF